MWQQTMVKKEMIRNIAGKSSPCPEISGGDLS